MTCCVDAEFAFELLQRPIPAGGAEIVRVSQLEIGDIELAADTLVAMLTRPYPPAVRVARMPAGRPSEQRDKAQEQGLRSDLDGEGFCPAVIVDWMQRRFGRLSALMAVATVLALSTVISSAHAEAPQAADSAVGIDVSWPQCGSALPDGMPFAVVGVTGGTAASSNPCLAEQLSWAFATTTGANPHQSRVQLYVNTANPGDVLEEYAVTTWPRDNMDSRGRDSFAGADEQRRNPYGRCTTTPGNFHGFTNDLACSWQYGWNRAVEAVDQRFVPAARAAGTSEKAADYTWWLDVETMNSWQHGGIGAHARNTATLEGMAQLYMSEGVETVGIYSTRYQWRQIVGDTLDAPPVGGPTVGGNLIGATSWLAGWLDAGEARIGCMTASGLTGGAVALNQYILDGLDHNYSCL